MSISALRTAALFGPTAAIFALWSVSDTHAYPGDVFETTAPAADGEVEAITEIQDNEYAVSEQNGAFSYNYPIAVPPGRNDMQPALALVYSSRHPDRGGVAMKWTLSIPMIRVDTSEGRLGEMQYMSTMAGNQRLVPVDEPAGPGGLQAYRAENDASYTRYQRLSPQDGWRALTSDGRTYYFGEGNAKDLPESARFMLSRVVDRFGNEIEYEWTEIYGNAYNGEATVIVDRALTKISYGKNDAIGEGHFVELRFEYVDELDTCPNSDIPIGARFDYSSGLRIYEGAARLERINMYVREPNKAFMLRRRVELDYDPAELDCITTGHAPMRILDSLQETAWILGAPSEPALETTLPAVEFEYTRRERQLDDHIELQLDGADSMADIGHSLGNGYRRENLNTPGEWPTVETLLLDLDGDGLQDILRTTPDELLDESNWELCTFQWRRNEGEGQFADWSAPRELPTFPWADGARRRDGEVDQLELCSLSHQLTRRMDPDHNQCRPQ